MKTNAEIEKWEDRFIRLKAPAGWDKMGAKEFVAQMMTVQMSFIRALLSSTLDERMEWVRGVVEGMKGKHEHDENCAEDEAMCNEMDDLMEARNQALQDVLNSITKGSKED